MSLSTLNSSTALFCQIQIESLPSSLWLSHLKKYNVVDKQFKCETDPPSLLFTHPLEPTLQPHIMASA